MFSITYASREITSLRREDKCSASTIHLLNPIKQGDDTGGLRYSQAE